MNLVLMGAMMALMMLFLHGRGHHGPAPEPVPSGPAERADPAPDRPAPAQAPPRPAEPPAPAPAPPAADQP